MRVATWRGARLCLPDRAVRGVLHDPRLSGVPAAPGWILGVCAAEGRAVSVVDLVCLGGERPAMRPPSVVLLIVTPAGLLGLAADDEPREAGDTETFVDIVVDPAHLPEQIAAALAGRALPPG